MEMGLETHLEKFNAAEKMFVLMPSQHTLNINCQIIGAKILKSLYDKENNNDQKKILKKALKHQLGHLNVLKKFKRFPKRNNILKRASTPEEIDYIDSTPKIPY